MALSIGVPSIDFGVIERWGRIAFFASLFYTVLSLLVTLSILSSGVDMPIALIPPNVQGMFIETFNLWGELQNTFRGGSIGLSEIFQLFSFSFNALISILGILLQSAINYIWIAIQVAEVIPPPYTLLTIIAWIVLGMLQLFVLVYIAQKLLSILQNFLSTILTRLTI